MYTLLSSNVYIVDMMLTFCVVYQTHTHIPPFIHVCEMTYVTYMYTSFPPTHIFVHHTQMHVHTTFQLVVRQWQDI